MRYARAAAVLVAGVALTVPTVTPAHAADPFAFRVNAGSRWAVGTWSNYDCTGVYRVDYPGGGHLYGVQSFRVAAASTIDPDDGSAFYGSPRDCHQVNRRADNDDTHVTTYGPRVPPKPLANADSVVPN